MQLPLTITLKNLKTRRVTRHSRWYMAVERTKGIRGTKVQSRLVAIRATEISDGDGFFETWVQVRQANDALRRIDPGVAKAALTLIGNGGQPVECQDQRIFAGPEDIEAIEGPATDGGEAD